MTIDQVIQKHGTAQRKSVKNITKYLEFEYRRHNDRFTFMPTPLASIKCADLREQQTDFRAYFFHVASMQHFTIRVDADAMPVRQMGTSVPVDVLNSIKAVERTLTAFSKVQRLHEENDMRNSGFDHVKTAWESANKSLHAFEKLTNEVSDLVTGAAIVDPAIELQRKALRAMQPYLRTGQTIDDSGLTPDDVVCAEKYRKPITNLAYLHRFDNERMLAGYLKLVSSGKAIDQREDKTQRFPRTRAIMDVLDKLGVSTTDMLNTHAPAPPTFRLDEHAEYVIKTLRTTFPNARCRSKSVVTQAKAELLAAVQCMYDATVVGKRVRRGNGDRSPVYEIKFPDDGRVIELAKKSTLFEQEVVLHEYADGKLKKRKRASTRTEIREKLDAASGRTKKRKRKKKAEKKSTVTEPCDSDMEFDLL